MIVEKERFIMGIARFPDNPLTINAFATHGGNNGKI